MFNKSKAPNQQSLLTNGRYIIPNKTLVQIAQSAARANINHLSIGVRFIEMHLKCITDTPGYEDLFEKDERVINVKAKIIRDKNSDVKEASCVYEVITPFTPKSSVVCTMGVYASGRCSGYGPDNEKSLQYFAFLIAQSLFDSDEYLCRISRKCLKEKKFPRFFPKTFVGLKKVCTSNFDVSVQETSNNVERKYEADIVADNETTLDEAMDVKNVHTAKKLVDKSFVLTSFVKGINI